MTYVVKVDRGLLSRIASLLSQDRCPATNELADLLRSQVGLVLGGLCRDNVVHSYDFAFFKVLGVWRDLKEFLLTRRAFVAKYFHHGVLGFWGFGVL